MSAIGRRKFLKLSGVTAGTAAVASLPLFHVKESAQAAVIGDGSGAVVRKKLGTWQDLYRQRWSWDYVAKGSHGWLNCRSACEWDLYVKNGVVVREEQTAAYEASEPGIPDFNPRGCQKGACYTEVMYGPSRLTVPLKRVGERGSGQWEKISWDKALDEIAEKMVDIAQEHGTDAVFHDLGPHFDYGATTAGRIRFFNKFGGVIADDWAEIGDLNLGATLTFGFPHVGGSSDEWFLSDFLVVWMMNPSVTQIPDAHYLYEAKYNGANLTVIDPVYSATAVHADQWVPIEAGTDAVLALYTARYIWENGHMDEAYVKEQTDLPMLVRLDNGRFLRESDLEEGGNSEKLYFWDLKQKLPVLAKGTEGQRYEPKIALEDIDPAIEGRFEVVVKSGEKLQVATVGSLLKEQLELWTLEAAAEKTKLHPDLITKFAKGFAEAERPMILSSWGSNRFYHSDMMNRSKILCLSLKGAVGKRGAGYHSTGWFSMEGFDHAAESEEPNEWGALKTAASLLKPGEIFDIAIDLVMKNKSLLEVGRDANQRAMVRGVCSTNSASMNYKYQGIADDLEKEHASLGYPRELKDYIDESQEKDWMPVLPRKAVKAWVTGGNNVLRRTCLPGEMLEHLWPKIDLVIDVNPKLTFTGMNADYLLPAAGYYEKTGFKYPVAYIPYVHYYDAAIKPIGESKDEWEIFHLLAQKVQKIARARNTPIFDGCGKKEVDLKEIADRFSFSGNYNEKDGDKVNQQILDLSMSTQGMKIEELKKTGIQKFKETGMVNFQNQLYNPDWKGEGVLSALTHFVKDKWHWPTLTGRQQFYIDHPWFINAGESLPAHKESPNAGGNYPLQLISCHSRWSVHSIWRDTPMLMRLQRGEPALYVNPQDAEKYGVKDGEFSELFNDYGDVKMRIKVTAMVRPSVAYYFHAWEPHQFPEHKSYKWITPGLMKPLHFAGGEGHLGWRFAIWEPGTAVQDTRIGLRPAKEFMAKEKSKNEKGEQA